MLQHWQRREAFSALAAGREAPRERPTRPRNEPPPPPPPPPPDHGARIRHGNGRAPPPRAKPGPRAKHRPRAKPAGYSPVDVGVVRGAGTWCEGPRNPRECDDVKVAYPHFCSISSIEPQYYSKTTSQQRSRAHLARRPEDVDLPRAGTSKRAMRRGQALVPLCPGRLGASHGASSVLKWEHPD